MHLRTSTRTKAPTRLGLQRTLRPQLRLPLRSPLRSPESPIRWACYESRHQSRPRSPLRGPATHTATDGGHTEGKREDRLAPRVGGAPQDQEALGTVSTSGGKRKDMHDGMVEEAECDAKQSCLATEPVAALVKMSIIPGGQTIPANGRVFYAARLEKTTIVGKADRYMFIHNAEKKKWVRMPAGARPVCVGEQLERYKRELKTHFP
ncbi:hypothetical protein B0H14DRAFT_2654150 [Mycena olivaceomarginata]|nr:hypothetical protein B0H14DRAFT_2654150 [Mycena olivaceomarginata]